MVQPEAVVPVVLVEELLQLSLEWQGKVLQ
jgi:hypothetical protein